MRDVREGEREEDEDAELRDVFGHGAKGRGRVVGAHAGERSEVTTKEGQGKVCD